MGLLKSMCVTLGKSKISTTKECDLMWKSLFRVFSKGKVLGHRNHAFKSNSLKGYAGMGVREKIFNFSLSTTFWNLTRKSFLLMEYHIHTPRCKSLLRRFRPSKTVIFWWFKNYVNHWAAWTSPCWRSQTMHQKRPKYKHPKRQWYFQQGSILESRILLT